MRMQWSIAVCAIAVCYGFPSYAADMRQDRITCLNGRSFKEVVKACTSVIEWSTVQTAERANAFSRRGTAYFYNGAFDLAIIDYGEAIKIEPANPDRYIGRGAANYAAGKFKDAIEDANRALALKPGDADIYFKRAMTFHKNGDLEHAVADYTEVIRLKPTFAEAYNNRGVIYLDRGEFERAISDFNRVIELDPQHEFAFNNRGNIYLYMSELENALNDYSQAIEIDPNYEVALSNRCWVRALLNRDLNAAIEDCSRANVSSFGGFEVRKAQGLIHLRMGRFADAIGAFDDALALVHDEFETLYLRGIAKLRAGEIANGNSDIAAATKIQPQVPEYFAQFGVSP